MGKATQKIKYEFLSYDDVHDYYRSVVNQVEESDFKPDVIVAIARGGLDMGVKLSHRLDIPIIPITYQTRDFQTDGKNFSVPSIMNAPDDNNILIVDDICDSGKTMEDVALYFYSRHTKFRIATAISDEKHLHNKLVDFTGRTINRNTDREWFVFPWEKVLIAED